MKSCHEKRMVLIRALILMMNEILVGFYQAKGQPQKRLWGGERFKEQTRLPVLLLERPVEFHDIQRARWKFPSEFSMSLSLCRITLSPAYSLSIHHSLPSLT